MSRSPARPSSGPRGGDAGAEALAVPKPQRSHADLFNLVTENLRSTPSPGFRQSSSNLSTQVISAVLQSVMEGLPIPESGPQLLLSEKTPSVDVATNQLAEYSASPFLGEQLSVHAGIHPALHAQESGKLIVDGMGILRMSRAQSLEGLSSVYSEMPCTLKMPRSKAFAELSDSLESIPPQSWILPYILACCPPALMQQLTLLPRLIEDDPNSASAIAASAGIAFSQSSPIPAHHPLRPRLASETDTQLRGFDLPAAAPLPATSFYQHKSFSSRPPFAAQNSFQSDSGTPRPTIVTPPAAGDMFSASPGASTSPSRTGSPALLCSLPCPASWRSLGTLLMTKNPSWQPWERRTLYLLNNFLLESTADGSKLIGFAPLAGARVARKPFTEPNRLNRPPIPTTPRRSEQQSQSYGLCVSCCTTSDPKSARAQFWITCTQLQDMAIIQSALTRASKLRVQDVFDIPILPEDGGLLGRGRFNEVRLARRRNYRVVDRRVLERMQRKETEAEAPLHSTPSTSTISQTVPIVKTAEDSKSSPPEDGSAAFSLSYSLDDKTGSSPLPHIHSRSSLEEETVVTPPDLDSTADNQTLPGDMDWELPSEDEDDDPQDTEKGQGQGRGLHDEENLESGGGSGATAAAGVRSSPNSSAGMCALKLVSKEVFWERVESGKERGDALVREVLAQLLLETHHFMGAAQLKPPSASSSIGGSSGKSSVLLNNPLPFVQIFSVFETNSGFALELELMESMDLFDKLAQLGAMSEDKVRPLIAQVVEAVSLCLRVGVCHRDIKLSNVTFPLKPSNASRVLSVFNGGSGGSASGQRNSSGTPSESGAIVAQGLRLAPPSAVPTPPLSQQSDDESPIVVKVADFGMAGFIGSDRKLRGRCGTPGYVAPDILLAGVNEPYGANVDIFSVGAMAYTLLCGYEPFAGADNHELMRANRMVEYEFHSPEWDHISKDAKDWIRRALLPAAEQRMNPEEAKKHPWLSEFFAQRGHSASYCPPYTPRLYPNFSTPSSESVGGFGPSSGTWCSSHSAQQPLTAQCVVS